MPQHKQLTDRVAIAGALGEADFAAVKAAGFATVVNFRPDGESRNQLASDDAREAAQSAGLAYHHVPTTKFEVLTDDVLNSAAPVLAGDAGPVLAYCASGQRAAIVWAAITARATPVDDVLATLKRAGLELDFLRDELEAQADRVRLAALSASEPTTQEQREPAIEPVSRLNRDHRQTGARRANSAAA